MAVAKASKHGGKMRTRTIAPGGAKGKRPELPINTADSNASGDKQAMALFVILCLISTAIIVGGFAFSTVNLIAATKETPVNWLGFTLSGLGMAVTFFLSRSFAWLSFFGAIMYASKVGAWSSQERLCRSALRIWRVFPGGACNAAMLLVQSLMTRGQFDEAITVGQEQYDLHAETKGFGENLAPLYSAVGMAYQVRGDIKDSIVWTDRAIEALSKSLEQLTGRTTIMGKLLGGPQSELSKSVKMQLAVAYFNNATGYFNTLNYRQAKQYYKQAVDVSNQSPDFPQKADILKVSRDQLSRLKHS